MSLRISKNTKMSTSKSGRERGEQTLKNNPPPKKIQTTIPYLKNLERILKNPKRSPRTSKKKKIPPRNPTRTTRNKNKISDHESFDNQFGLALFVTSLPIPCISYSTL